jgi:DNA-binding XRE family transcriptional regulator
MMSNTVATAEELGIVLRDLRIDAGLSQAAAAESAGMSQQAWQRLEVGRDAQLSTWDRAFWAVGVDVVRAVQGAKVQ